MTTASAPGTLTEPPAPTPPVTETVARRARQYAFDALPPSVVVRARHCFLDWLGVAVAGSREPAARLTRELALTERAPAQASLVGRPERVGLTQATLVNGVASHVLDFDDVSAVAGGHPSVPVFPAILAVAERDRRSGRDFLTAFVAGIETEGRVGLLVAPGHYAAGWHSTATIGTFGAAAASAHLLGLDQAQMQMALGIAGTQAAGLKSMFGTMCKSLHAGKAAVNGLTAALLAERGFTSHPEVLETEQGFGWTQTSTFNPERALTELDDRYAIDSVVFKRHAACFGTHSSIEGLLKLRREVGFEPDDVDGVRLRVSPGLLAMCNIERPSTGLEGKFSLTFTSALALTGRDTSDRGFTDDVVREPALVALRDRVSVEPVDPAETGPTEVLVRLRDGRDLSARVDVRFATPDDQLGEEWAALAHKFRGLTTPILGAAATEDLLERIAGLEDVDSMRTIARLASTTG